MKSQDNSEPASKETEDVQNDYAATQNQKGKEEVGCEVTKPTYQSKTKSQRSSTCSNRNDKDQPKAEPRAKKMSCRTEDPITTSNRFDLLSQASPDE
ncbi:predicted protein [Arabidopsis lyrata subsp. lyrata]|uniref:Predicted protein n=1 Tax=Arabidopsis lyrata subsp. lyrata TaxID=81972 RepID=D7M4M9_ARALL|nr:predicted protein [Arabidopsis lyrata subsp. lyrata]